MTYTSGTDVVSVERMLLELGLPKKLGDSGHEDFDEEEVDRLTGHINAAVDHVGVTFIGGSLLDKTSVVNLSAPAPEQVILVDLPHFKVWTEYSYFADGEDGIYGTATEGTFADADADGYPPTFFKAQAHLSTPPREIIVHPNGLDDGNTKRWPALADDSHLKLTASLGWSSVPEAVKQAVVIVCRSFYDGYERVPMVRRDAARALCTPYRLESDGTDPLSPGLTVNVNYNPPRG